MFESLQMLPPDAILGLIAEHGIAWVLPRLVGTGAAKLILNAQPPILG